jgi:hypothetical protein
VIHKALVELNAEIVDDEVKKAQAKVEDRIRRNAAEVCVRVVDKMSFEAFGQEILIKLHIPSGKETK